jgi:hypothetical protein
MEVNEHLPHVELLTYYQSLGDRIITVLPAELSLARSLVSAVYLEEVNDGEVYQVRNCW